MFSKRTLIVFVVGMIAHAMSFDVVAMDGKQQELSGGCKWDGAPRTEKTVETGKKQGKLPVLKEIKPPVQRFVGLKEAKEPMKKPGFIDCCSSCWDASDPESDPGSDSDEE
jgi:hypothetical protein